MTEKRIRSGCKYRRQAFPVRGDTGVADSEDSPVEPMQMAGADSTVNCAPRIAKRTRQLPYRDDAVLPLRQIRK